MAMIQDFTKSVLIKRKASISMKSGQAKVPNAGEECEEKKREPFMDILIRENMLNPTEFTDQDIQDEVETFMAAGHDTTGWAMVWTTYLVGLHPEVQEKLHSEIDHYFETRTQKDITVQGLKKDFPYLDSVIKESMRLYPPGAINTRTTEKDTQIGPYTVPPGVQLVFCYAAIHRNPKHWPDPNRFDPDRFYHHHKRHPYAFLPFSAGPRNCIGQKFALLELKSTLIRMFRRFKITSLDPQDKVYPTVAFMLKPEIPVRVRLELRSHSDPVTRL
jgi:cytochrome P450